jgi:hypothetical protein
MSSRLTLSASFHNPTAGERTNLIEVDAIAVIDSWIDFLTVPLLAYHDSASMLENFLEGEQDLQD